MISRFTRKDFLEALFLDYYREHKGFILVKSLRRGDPKMSTRYFPNIDILAKEQYTDERDVYYGICPRERMKAEKEHVHYFVALWADLDIGKQGHDEKEVYFEGPQQAARAIRSFPRAPSIIVESGRGAHLYWLMKEVREVDDPERIEAVLKKISEHLNCDTDVSLDTVLRLPETINTKIPDQLVNCDVKFINTNFRYMLEDFENLGKRIVTPSMVETPTELPTRQPDLPSMQPSAPKQPVQRPQQRAAVQPAPTAQDNTVADSLIVDETIIDELIDDISMTASGPDAAAPEMSTTDSDFESVFDSVAPPPTNTVFDEPAPSPPPQPSRPSPPQPSRPSPPQPEPQGFELPQLETQGFELPQPEPPQPTPPKPAPPPAPPRAAPKPPPVQAPSGQPSYTSTVLERLVSTKAHVEISFIGSEKTIAGQLAWNHNGLIGVEAEGFLYTIPLNSVAFIRSQAV